MTTETLYYWRRIDEGDCVRCGHQEAEEDKLFALLVITPGEMPKLSVECGYCQWTYDRSNLAEIDREIAGRNNDLLTDRGSEHWHEFDVMGDGHMAACYSADAAECAEGYRRWES